MASLVKTDKISTTAGGAQEFTLPAADGTANQHLKTDGSGVLGWATPPTGIALTGSTNTWIPTITAANALTGTANFTYDGNTLDIKNGGTASSINLYCESSNAHYTKIKSGPHASATSYTITLPNKPPTVSGQALTATTAGVGSWTTTPQDMVLLDTVNADSGSSASFESKFDSTYNWYVMYWQLVPGTNAAETSVQFMSGSSVVAPGNKYEYSWNGTVMHTGAAVVGYGTGQNDVRFGNSTSNATFGQSGQAIIFDPNNNFAAGEFLNGRFQVTWRLGGNYYISAQGGFVFGVDQGGADGFYFAPTSGTWTYFDAQLYGVK